MTSIGRTTILVHDLDQAKRFYADAFGFETLFDGEVAHGLRTVHVGPHGERGAGLWFLVATDAASIARVGAQTGGEPALVLYVDDLADEMERLTSIGVRVVKPLVVDGATSFAHVLDDSGNELVLVQLPPLDAPGPAAVAEAEN